MRRYSVYDYNRRRFDYYDAPGPGGSHADSPPKARHERDIGAPPEAAAWRLPSGATKVGSGDRPQGRIASMDGADAVAGHAWLIAAAALLIAWKVLR